MIGSSYKKYAKEFHMKVSNGVAYGVMHGYAVTLDEGAGFKRIVIATRFDDPVRGSEMSIQVNGRNVNKDFRVQNITVAPKNITIMFMDNPGTMKKIREFVDWYFPMLDAYGASKANTCVECGQEITSGEWKLIEGVAYYMHASCAERIRNALAQENTQRKENAEGSYLSGAAGAFLGALLGAVVWGIVLYMGYLASIVGLLIGWLAERGYRLLHGKEGKAKVVILILAIIFGVLVGTIAPDVAVLLQEIAGGNSWLTVGEIPSFLLYLFLTDSEYSGAVLSNAGLGLLFAALGVFALLRNVKKANSDAKMINLK